MCASGEKVSCVNLSGVLDATRHDASCRDVARHDATGRDAMRHDMTDIPSQDVT